MSKSEAAGAGKTVIIIGGGWYGSHVACELAKQGHDVTLLEANDRVFSGISGKFGIRTHVGTHYPRSAETRKHCAKCLAPFMQLYPELTNRHLFAIYALGIQDLTGHDSKVTESAFRDVCEEVPGWTDIPKKELAAWGINPETVHMAADMPEPSIILGERLRTFFEQRLAESGVTVRCSTRVNSAHQGAVELADGSIERADVVINTTSCKALFPAKEELPFDMDIVYQVCLALKFNYRGGLRFIDKKTGETRELDPNDPGAVGSFITMDGWFPCWMPYDNREDPTTPFTSYIGTHGKLTIAGSYQTPGEATHSLSSVNDEFMEHVINTIYRKHMAELWPAFSEADFKYVGWTGEVLAKIKSNREFRSAVTFQSNGSGLIHVIPGKIINVIDVMEEVQAQIDGHNLISDGTSTYMAGGTLDGAGQQELVEAITVRNTCDLNTFAELNELFRREGMTPQAARDFIKTFPTATAFYKHFEGHQTPRLSARKAIAPPDLPLTPSDGGGAGAGSGVSRTHGAQAQAVWSRRVTLPRHPKEPQQQLPEVAFFLKQVCSCLANLVSNRRRTSPKGVKSHRQWVWSHHKSSGCPRAASPDDPMRYLV